MVTLSIFSGNPDPVLNLSQDVQDDIAARLARSVGQQAAAYAEPPGLGYRGFVVTNSGGVANVPSLSVVYGGTVAVVAESGETATWSDSEGIEQQLLQQARELGYGTILDQAGGAQANA